MNRKKLISAVDNALMRHTASIRAKESDVIASVASPVTHPSQTKVPGVISNKALYSRCNVTPLSTRVNWFRWRMLGHVLRGAEDSPAYLSMLFAINSDINFKGRLGRPSINLLDVIRKDLVRKNINNALRSTTEFENLRFMALDRKSWKDLEQL